MVQNPSPPRIRPYRSWDLLQYAKHDFVRRGCPPELNVELNWTEWTSNWTNWTWEISGSWMNWTERTFQSKLEGRNWTELKPKSFELWTGGSQKFTNCPGPGHNQSDQVRGVAKGHRDHGPSLGGSGHREGPVGALSGLFKKAQLVTKIAEKVLSKTSEHLQWAVSHLG